MAGFAWDGITLAFELAFGDKFTTVSPTWVDVTGYVDAFHVKGGRSSLQNQYQGRSSVWLLDNTDDRFNPNNTSSPYSPDVLLGVPARITVTHNAVDYVVFRGLVDEWPMAYGYGPRAQIQLPLSDFTKVLTRIAPTGSRTSRTTDEMIEEILDDVFWPSAIRDIDTGVASTPDIDFDDVGGSAFEFCEWVANAEAGHFFIAADGDATFRNRVASSGGSASQATFGPGASEIKYEDVSVVYDGVDVFNSVFVAPLDEDEFVGRGFATITSPLGYESSLEVTAAVESRTHANNVADWLLGRYGTLRPRIRKLTFAPNVVDAWPTSLGLDLRDVVTVKVPGDGTSDDLEQDCAIEHITHSAVGGGKWLTTWDLYPLSDLEQEDFWILGTSELGTETNLA